MSWIETAPAKPGLWRLHCSEAPETELVKVVDRCGTLWAEDCAIGSLPVGDLHNGLSMPQWKFVHPVIEAVLPDRVTEEMVEAAIISETYTVLPSGKVMVCELTVRNGFTVRGEAAVVSVSNFNEAKGREISRRRAVDKVWELEGFLLQQRRYEASL